MVERAALEMRCTHCVVPGVRIPHFPQTKSSEYSKSRDFFSAFLCVIDCAASLFVSVINYTQDATLSCFYCILNFLVCSGRSWQGICIRGGRAQRGRCPRLPLSAKKKGVPKMELLFFVRRDRAFSPHGRGLLSRP